HIPNSSFFFQAEDGIRDFHVTGVQTCALPISSNTMKIKKITLAIPAAAPAIPPKPSTAAISAMTKNVNAQPNILCSLVRDAQIRSEERRVGKGCRAGGSTYQQEIGGAGGVQRR